MLLRGCGVILPRELSCAARPSFPPRAPRTLAGHPGYRAPKKSKVTLKMQRESCPTSSSFCIPFPGRFGPVM